MNPIPSPGEEWTWKCASYGWSKDVKWTCDYVENNRVWWHVVNGHSSHSRWSNLDEVVSGKDGWRPVIMHKQLLEGECV